MNIRHKSTLAAVLAGVISVALLPSSTAGTLNLTNSNTSTTEAWTITGNITVDGQGNVTLTATPPGVVQACTTAGTLGFSSGSYSVAEGSTTNITVNRTVCGVGAVTVNYGTSDGTAVAGDYTTASGTLSWANGETGSKTFSVATQGEATAITESNKTVNLALSGITGGATQGTAAATLTITDVGGSVVNDPTCPALPSGLTIRDATQNLGTNVTYKNAANQAYAVRITAGLNGEVSWSSAQVTGITSTSQIVSVSRCRGDFTQTYPCGQNSSQSYIGYVKSNSAAFSTCKLDPAISTYYVNVRNATFSSGADTCGSGKLCGLLLNIK